MSDAAQQSAWRHRDRLSVQDRAHLTVVLGPRFPAPSHYREVIAAAEHLVQIAPEDPQAWIELGLGLFGEGPLLGLPEAHARAAAAFARAVALDSANVPALSGLSVAAAALDDTVTARKTLALLSRQRPDSASWGTLARAGFRAAMPIPRPCIGCCELTAPIHQVEGTSAGRCSG
jgi:cytochrome c-type biogenesis protein CcmH/NrfG